MKPSERLKEFTDSPNFIRTIVSEAKKNNATASELVRGLTQQQLNWKPDAKQWSIAQCLEHLAVTSRQFNSYFRQLIESARLKWPTNGAIPYRPSLVGGWLIKQVVPETTRKVPAPKVFKPSDSSSIQDPLGLFLKQQEEFVRFVHDSEGVDYNRARLRSPVTPLMRYSLADAFVVTIVHGYRHLAQANRIKAMPNFPN
ncbi:MAG TPA: DinB family protein [Pyrinomonadaceae bacterium]|nr:DinB family protein [Pyrinomonadaceae bacterium]